MIQKYFENLSLQDSHGVWSRESDDPLIPLPRLVQKRFEFFWPLCLNPLVFLSVKIAALMDEWNFCRQSLLPWYTFRLLEIMQVHSHQKNLLQCGYIIYNWWKSRQNIVKNTISQLTLKRSLIQNKIMMLKEAGPSSSAITLIFIVKSIFSEKKKKDSNQNDRPYVRQVQL